jgi:hypothetical protein
VDKDNRAGCRAACPPRRPPIEFALPDAANPFTDVAVTGEFIREGGMPLKAFLTIWPYLRIRCQNEDHD